MPEPTSPPPAGSPATRPPLRVLVIEDSEFDARVIVSLLRGGGYAVTFRRVDTAPAMRAALAGETWDIVFSDHQMPEFDAAQALRVLQESGHDLPFIIVSGGIGEETAVALMKAGAHDFLMKGQLGRLLPATQRELREAQNRAARRESELRYRRLWETSPDAILMMDATGQIAFVNPAGEHLFGRTAGELLHHDFRELLSPESASTFTIGRSGEIASGTPGMVELVGRHAAGNPVIMEVAFTDMDLQGQRWHIAFARDITARRLAENALQQAEQEFELARDIQRHLFPKAPPEIAGFDIAGSTSAAVEAGGDYYDFLPMPEGDLGLIVSDVSGHGVGPALIMAETRAYLRLAAKNRRDAGLVLTRANEVLSQDLEDSGRFVTALLVRLDPVARRLTYANAGHTAGYVLDGSGGVKQTLNQRRAPLGLTASTLYQETEPVALAPGDLVLLLTDGVEEAEGPDGSVFGPERVLATVRAAQQRPATAVIEALRAALLAFAEGQPQKDDLTMIVAKVR